MNTWTSWGLADRPFTAAGVVLHSVPPLVVFATAETGPGLRDRLTEAVRRSLVDGPTGAHARQGDTASLAVHEPARPPITASVHEVHEPPVNPPATPAVTPAVTPSGALDTGAAGQRPAVRPSRPVKRPGRRAAAPAAGRRLLADYVADARAALDTARAAGKPVQVTAAWCRRVTGCSAGTSVKVAAAIRGPSSSPAVPAVPVRSARREEAA
jgi:hypothetical protein